MIDLSLAALTFGVALITATVVTMLVLRTARKLAGTPAQRWEADTVSVPRVGGIPVLAGFAAGVATPLWLIGYSGTLFGAARYHWIGWIGSVLALFLCGLADDLRGLGPLTKLAFQSAGALVIYAAGFRIEFVQLPWDGVLHLHALSLPVTVLWTVGVTNAINLIDGLDGLAAGVAFLITSTIVIVSAHQGVFPVTVIAIALSGSLLGFLWFNVSPARIILGDSGSQFLGFTLAVISVRGLQKSATAVAILVPVLLLGLPILDMFLVILRRGWRIHATAASRDVQLAGGRVREWISRSRGFIEGDREHIHHNLLDLGLSRRKTALLLYVTTALFCATAFGLVILRDPRLALSIALFAASATTVLKFWAVRRRVTVKDPQRSPVNSEPVLPKAMTAEGDGRC